jgi:hypothetical protein
VLLVGSEHHADSDAYMCPMINAVDAGKECVRSHGLLMICLHITKTDDPNCPRIICNLERNVPRNLFAVLSDKNPRVLVIDITNVRA